MSERRLPRNSLQGLAAILNVHPELLKLVAAKPEKYYRTEERLIGRKFRTLDVPVPGTSRAAGRHQEPPPADISIST